VWFLATGAYSVPLLDTVGVRFPLQAAKVITGIVNQTQAVRF
jgi:hypothetical protein